MPGYVDPKIVEDAKRIDLLTYLRTYEPSNLVRVGNNVYSTKEHDSLRISNGKWCWWSRGIGGASALDYLIKVQEMSFLDAINVLTSKLVHEPVIKAEPEIIHEFVLPVANKSTYNIQAYLEKRGILPEIIEYCIANGSLYEEKEFHNAVFVGYDNEHVARYAQKRSTGSTRYVGEVGGTNKSYSFCMESNRNEKNQAVHLFESAIDAMSYASFLKMYGRDWKGESLLSLAGVYAPKRGEIKVPAALKQYLDSHTNTHVINLHLDNDNAGMIAAKALTQLLEKQYRVINDPPGRGKDVNEELCIARGFPIIHQHKSRGRDR